MGMHLNDEISGLRLDNITDGETVHQRCVLLTGQCWSADSKDASYSETDYLRISTSDAFGPVSFPVQTWPIARSHFKALVFLSPGINQLRLEHHRSAEVIAQLECNLNYIPLSQLPPLGLAIMVAKDSPLLIDCPPSKQRGISSGHADLDAAIAKLRMTAYMWQAMTAEDMRVKGLGRRSFRLEEEWTVDTVSRQFINAKYNEDPLYDDAGASASRATAKIHIVKSDKTVAELRNVHVAQQNPHGHPRDDVHRYFSDALKAHGDPFLSSARPVVAGLILDSTYSTQKDLILAHAALGSHNAEGLSLGIFGSHLTYSWPRFVEEVPACLLDTTPRDETTGNDNGECDSNWEACSVGQGAFLHEVGHAFGASHTTGIMARGYPREWAKNFLPLTAWSRHTKKPGEFVAECDNETRWDLGDALSFSMQPHFRLPGEKLLSRAERNAFPSVHLIEDSDGPTKIAIEHARGIVRIEFNNATEPGLSVSQTQNRLKILARNGKLKPVGNLWRLVRNWTLVCIPGSSITLQKRSIAAENLERSDNENRQFWEWAVMLNRRKADGTLTRAKAIDMRVGMLLDGAVVYFDGKDTVPCGSRRSQDGSSHWFGGHASEKIDIPEGVDVSKVEITRGDDTLWGMRIRLSNGQVGGELNENNGEVEGLEPASNQKIVGFYGRSRWPDGFMEILEFGIITAPRDVELPMAVYDMRELQNTDGGVSTPSSSQERQTSDDEEEEYDYDDDDDDDDDLS